MKICIVGKWEYEHYESAFAKALEDSGVEVIALNTSQFLAGSLSKYAEALSLPSLAICRTNHYVIRLLLKARPTYVLFWRCTYIWPSTIEKLQSAGVKTISYNNDDPFSISTHRYANWVYRVYWRWYINSLKHHSFNYFYRKVNCQDAFAYGATHSALLLPYFMPWRDKPVKLTEKDQKRFSSDIVFVGHYEPDGREGCLRALLEAGFDVKVWGGRTWRQSNLAIDFHQLNPIIPAQGNDYAKVLAGAKICLAFLSKLNRDTYTRRCFEIPACNRVMLAERTRDLQQLFKEDEEACFFSSKEELLQKARYLLNNPGRSHEIAEAGRRRVWADGHDVGTRAKDFILSLG